ncbi:MAG: DUF3489 domain-containing protein [Gammaproteobacteria bacterium]|nr:DUF3489 domain-containing protein [Gammaproteobacteria bacterium]
MNTPQLTPAQHAILAYAIEHTGGRIEWFPDNIKGGARKKVLDGLFNRALITRDSTDWFVAAEGYDALGCARPAPAPAPLNTDPEIKVAVTATEAMWAQERVETKPRTRENSKQATVIQMLRRPEGATVRQICDETGWQAHTVRGTFAGAFKKKLGLTIVSEKPDNGERVYRIV